MTNEADLDVKWINMPQMLLTDEMNEVFANIVNRSK